jgi:hypothetical protein
MIKPKWKATTEKYCTNNDVGKGTNKTTSGLLRYVGHWIYNEDLCFQNVIESCQNSRNQEKYIKESLAYFYKCNKKFTERKKVEIRLQIIDFEMISLIESWIVKLNTEQLSL